MNNIVDGLPARILSRENTIKNVPASLSPTPDRPMRNCPSSPRSNRCSSGRKRTMRQRHTEKRLALPRGGGPEADLLEDTDPERRASRPCSCQAKLEHWPWFLVDSPVYSTRTCSRVFALHHAGTGDSLPEQRRSIRDNLLPRISSC
jgi:hypothetical protein